MNPAAMRRSLLAAVLLTGLGCEGGAPRAERTVATSPEALMSIPPEAPAKAPARPPARPAPAAPAPDLPDPLPGRRTDITSAAGDAVKVAVGDLDGDRRAELVFVDGDRVRVADATGRPIADAPGFGGIRALEVVGGGAVGEGAAVVAGWGDTALHRQTPERIDLYRLRGRQLSEELVATPRTSRNDVVAMLGAGRQLLLAYFESKYMVKTSLAERGEAGWTLRDVASIRMAMSWARGDVDGDGAPDLVVGRLYGDDAGVDGEAFLLRPDGARVRIPTTRGVRGLAVADTDRDGKAEVFLGDGWHQAYRDQARGLLTTARWDGSAFRSELVEDTRGQYALMRILPADVDGDGVPELVTQGSSYVRVFRREGGHWRGLTVAASGRDVAVGPLDGEPGDEIVVIGDRSERISLRGARWQ